MSAPNGRWLEFEYHGDCDSERATHRGIVARTAGVWPMVRPNQLLAAFTRRLTSDSPTTYAV